MPANAKEVKVRLGSIKNTRKITKAMELVAASKMRRAVDATLETRAYHEHAWGIVERLINSRLWFDSKNPVKRFFEPAADASEDSPTTIVLFAGNRGLAGAFNANVLKLALAHLAKLGKNRTRIVAIGTRGAATLSALGFEVHLAFKKDDTAEDDRSVLVVADSLYRSFRAMETNRVLVAYTNYKSAIAQEAVMKQLFPFKLPPEVGALDEDASAVPASEKKNGLEYLYEPNKFEVLEYLTPRIAEAELYQALLESNASEHSARMVAMKNASDAAAEMAEDLTLEYNKARQAAITQEIAEISAGRAAVS